MTETTIGMLIFPGLTLLDLMAPFEIFRATPGITSFFIAEKSETIFVQGAVSLTPEYTFSNVPNLDILFVPGGPGIHHAIRSTSTLHFLAEHGKTARYITSVCTGALILGAAGLLQGYQATTHWRYLDLLLSVGAEPRQERVVRDRNRITGAGVTAGIDFGLMLIAELFGSETAQKVQLQLEYDPAPPFQAGHPRSAPENITQTVTKRTEALFIERKELLETLLLHKKH